jgi:hypothetical protein
MIVSLRNVGAWPGPRRCVSMSGGDALYMKVLVLRISLVRLYLPRLRIKLLYRSFPSTKKLWSFEIRSENRVLPALASYIT